MITPRRTRLVRVADLHEFRQAIRTLCTDSSAVLVPTRGAATELSRTLAVDATRPLLLTRDQLYDELHSRLPSAPRRLTVFERDAMAQSAAEQAAKHQDTLPFRIRPGLVAEMLRFYDLLRRQSQQVARFETLITAALGGDAGTDRGADRLLAQTRFLADAFRGYEERVSDSDGCDEHELRDRLIAEPAAFSLRHIVVTVPDWIADPSGLFVADFDLLARLPGLERLDLVCTESILGSGFHERIHTWWPGLDEISAAAVGVSSRRDRPRLAYPDAGEPDRLWFTFRDRQEELEAVARRLSVPEKADPATWNRVAIVFKQPLPYLYLAPETFGAAGVDYQVIDALPLAAEPVIATVDLILDLVETRFSRDSLIAILSSPHLCLGGETGPAFRRAVAELNKQLSDSRYLGGIDRLEAFAASAPSRHTNGDRPAVQAALDVAGELAALADPRPASQQIEHLSAFLERHWRPLDATDPFAAREQRAREALTQILRNLAAARRAHHDEPWTIEELAAAVRKWIGDETFPVESAAAGVHFVDDQAARYGDFDDITIVGLIDSEWPDRARRNIFYPPGLLKALGWPSERDRRAADEVRFLDLLGSASVEVALSAFSLDDETIVMRSVLLDEVPRARLSSQAREAIEERRGSAGESAEWKALRAERSSSEAAGFHGATGRREPQTWSISALETYTTCPFKFFAQHILKLEEEPDDEEVMDPRRQGQFVHKVFEAFFMEWQAAGHGAITGAHLEAARRMFTAVVDRALTALPEGEAGLERTRLLGSPAAAGLGEAVFRMEAERAVPVVERLLEHELKGPFLIATDAGSREVHLRGKVDRVDLLADGSFRLIDYKLGWPPDRSRALQLPIYSLCAEQRLAGRHGRRWVVGEAMYLAFKGPKRVVPLFATTSARDEMFAAAQQRLADTLDAIDRGEFPPTPDDVYRCETCSFASVCRKDYVGNV